MTGRQAGPGRGQVLAGGAGHQLLQLDAVQGDGQVFEHVAKIRRIGRQRLDALHQRGAVAGAQGLEQATDLATVDGAEHGDHGRLAQLAAGVGDGLVEQGQAVAQAAVGGARQQFDRGRLRGDALGFQDALHLPGDLAQFEPAQVELQAARKHRHRQFLRVGGGQQELHVAGRLFKRLEQRIERALGQHVHFVDQVDLGAAARRHVLGVVDQFAHVVDAGVAGGVDLEQVDVAAGVDVHAGAALTAGFGTAAAFAVERLGEDAGDGGLADATGAGEQEGVVHLAGFQGIGKRAHDVLLAHQFGEAPGAPFAGKDEIGHGAIVPTPLPPGQRA